MIAINLLGTSIAYIDTHRYKLLHVETPPSSGQIWNYETPTHLAALTVSQDERQYVDELSGRRNPGPGPEFQVQPNFFIFL